MHMLKLRDSSQFVCTLLARANRRRLQPALDFDDLDITSEAIDLEEVGGTAIFHGSPNKRSAVKNSSCFASIW